MRSLAISISILGLAASLTACFVVPVRPAYGAPPGVAYLAPFYAAPAPGYGWAYHARFGWGWRHPDYGWHRGWN